MKKSMNRSFFVVFLALWCVLTVWNGVNHPADYSVNEARYLADFPNFTVNRFIQGEYMRGIDNYVNDHFILRDSWITVQSTAEYLLGKRESNGVYIGKNALLPKLDLPNEKVTQANIDGINFFTQAYGVPSYIMLVPSAGAVQPNSLPAFAQDWGEEARISQIYASLQGVEGVDTMAALRAHSQQYIYYRTDHHWTTYGAYLAYTQVCAAAGLTADQYAVKNETQGFCGTLYSKSGVRFIPEDSLALFDTAYDGGCKVTENGKAAEAYPSVYFTDYLTQKDKYSVFTGPNRPLVTLYGTHNTGRSLLMFKDSYAHSMAPMLLKNYDKITMVDLRYIDKAGFAALVPQDYDAVLYLYSLDTFVHESFAQKIMA